MFLRFNLFYCRDKGGGQNQDSRIEVRRRLFVLKHSFSVEETVLIFMLVEPDLYSIDSIVL